MDITNVVFAPGVDEVTGNLEQRRFGERHITMVPDSTQVLSAVVRTLVACRRRVHPSDE
jgi:hypothetical protein